MLQLLLILLLFFSPFVSCETKKEGEDKDSSKEEVKVSDDKGDEKKDKLQTSETHGFLHAYPGYGYGFNHPIAAGHHHAAPYYAYGHPHHIYGYSHHLLGYKPGYGGHLGYGGHPGFGGPYYGHALPYGFGHLHPYMYGYGLPFGYPGHYSGHFPGQYLPHPYRVPHAYPAPYPYATKNVGPLLFPGQQTLAYTKQPVGYAGPVQRHTNAYVSKAPAGYNG